MNKKKGLIYSSLLVLLSLLSFVSADLFTDISSRGPTDVIRFIQDFFTPFFEAIIGTNSSEFFFAKVLILILLFSVISFSLKRVPTFKDQGGIVMIIAAVIAIIAVRFISENEFTTGILLPYATTGIVLGTILPIFVIFLFLHWGGFAGPGRRLTWVFVLVTMLILGISESDKIPSTLASIYWVMFALVIAFLFFDNGLHYYFKKWELDKFYTGANQRTIAALQAEYLNIVNVTSPEARARRTAIETQLRALNATVP